MNGTRGVVPEGTIDPNETLFFDIAELDATGAQQQRRLDYLDRCCRKGNATMQRRQLLPSSAAAAPSDVEAVAIGLGTPVPWKSDHVSRS